MVCIRTKIGPNFKIKFSEIDHKFRDKFLSSCKCALLRLKKSNFQVFW